MSTTATTSLTPGQAEARAYVGRQPIFDCKLDVIAYELLYRDSDVNAATFVGGDRATGQVVLNTLIEIGLEQVVEQHDAYINVTASYVLDGFCEALPSDRVVIELLEGSEPTPQLIEALKHLHMKGYRIALDDFVYISDFDELVEIADIVKLDARALSPIELEKNVAILRERNVKLLAEKIETHEEFEFCKDLGFDYFQGHFICKPQILSGRMIQPDRLATMQLLAHLYDSKLQIRDLQALISRDPSLSAKLLRFVNSSFCAVRREVGSIHQAVTLVGVKRIKIWAGLLTFGSFLDKPRELITTANVRAKMCERLAVAVKRSDPDQYFTVGLFSLLDAFADCQMSEILETLPLTDEIKGALLSREGDLGETLHCVMAYEQGDWNTVKNVPFNTHTVSAAYIEAVEWTDKIMDEMKM